MLKKAKAFTALIFFCSFLVLISFGKASALSVLSDEIEIYSLSGSFIKKRTTVSARVFPFVGKVEGEACYTDKSLEEIFFTFNAEEVFAEKTVYGESFYGFSEKLPYCADINGKRVNIQYFRGKDIIKVGTPVIFGSY